MSFLQVGGLGIECGRHILHTLQYSNSGRKNSFSLHDIYEPASVNVQWNEYTERVYYRIDYSVLLKLNRSISMTKCLMNDTKGESSKKYDRLQKLFPLKIIRLEHNNDNWLKWNILDFYFIAKIWFILWNTTNLIFK